MSGLQLSFVNKPPALFFPTVLFVPEMLGKKKKALKKYFSGHSPLQEVAPSSAPSSPSPKKAATGAEAGTCG